MTVQLTATQIEEMLAQEEYKPIARLNKRDLTETERKEVNQIEQITSFGQDIISLFDDMVDFLEELPTQHHYVNAGINKMLRHIAENKPEIEVTTVMVEACKLRLTRTYMSKVIELHLEAVIRETLPQYKIITAPMIDSVMGVDFILEDDKKRYYIHVTSNTPMALEMLKKKETRGGCIVGRAYIPYCRDFSGDLILKYDIHTETDTTKIINCFPLFKQEYVEWKLLMARKSVKIGEDLLIADSKLNHFVTWAKNRAGLDVMEGA